MPQVSVILNAYNQADYVREAVDSVLAQTFDDYELIVVDNGSTDGTPEILRPYAAHPKVTLVRHETNVAITTRFNEAVRMARGEFISFLYSDDLYLPAKLERQVAAFAAHPRDYGVVYGPAQGFNALTGRRWRQPCLGASGWVLRPFFLEHERGQIDMISPMIRRACLVEHPFFEDIFAEGEGVFMRIALTWKFLYLDEPLAVMRDHAANAGKAIERNAEFTWMWLDRLARHPKFPDDLHGALRRYRVTLLRNYGWQSMRVGGNVAWGRARLVEAVRHDWRQACHPRVLAGMLMSLLPASVRLAVNRQANRRRRSPGNALYVEDFGGAGSRQAKAGPTAP